MKPATKRILSALVLSLALAAAWNFLSSRRRHSRQEKDAVFSYVRGPLSDLSLGLTRALPALDGKKKDLRQALDFMRASIEGAKSLAAGAPEGYVRQQLRLMV